MEKSIILMFIKFFDECIISKRMKKIKNWLQFITFLLAVVFSGMFANIITNIDCNNVSFSVEVFVTIIYLALIIMALYFKETIVILLFPNEYILMNSIKCYLGKIFRDFYLSDITDDKVMKHIDTLSYYIANLYDFQRIKSENHGIFSTKLSILACTEFTYFINNKLKYNEDYIYKTRDLTSEQIADMIFSVLITEYENEKNMKFDSKIDIELNEFLNSKFGQKFIDENVIYDSVIFDEYECDEWWLYNKRNLPVIEHTPFYKKHIKNNNKESYNKKLVESKKKKEEKTHLSWIDNI